MVNPSYYISTRRSSVDQSGYEKAKKLYGHNYGNLLPVDRKAMIIDLGCSEGISLEWLMENGFSNIVGIDSDPFAIEQVNKRLVKQADRFKAVCCDIGSYLKDCPDNSVDMFIMFNVIEHINKNILLDIMSDIKRVLVPGGSFLAQTGNFENPFNIGLFTRDFTHEILFTRSSLQQLMVLSGFEPSSITTGGVKYPTTMRNLALQVISPVVGFMVKLVAKCMRMNIHETATLIFCVTTKDKKE